VKNNRVKLNVRLMPRTPHRHHLTRGVKIKGAGIRWGCETCPFIDTWDLRADHIAGPAYTAPTRRYSPGWQSSVPKAGPMAQEAAKAVTDALPMMKVDNPRSVLAFDRVMDVTTEDGVRIIQKGELHSVSLVPGSHADNIRTAIKVLSDPPHCPDDAEAKLREVHRLLSTDAGDGSKEVKPLYQDADSPHIDTPDVDPWFSDDELSAMTVPALYDTARDMNAPGITKKTRKADLITAIKKQQGESNK
jgi:hypothetical protein